MTKETNRGLKFRYAFTSGSFSGETMFYASREYAFVEGKNTYPAESCETGVILSFPGKEKSRVHRRGKARRYDGAGLVNVPVVRANDFLLFRHSLGMKRRAGNETGG